MVNTARNKQADKPFPTPETRPVISLWWNCIGIDPVLYKSKLGLGQHRHPLFSHRPSYSYSCVCIYICYRDNQPFHCCVRWPESPLCLSSPFCLLSSSIQSFDPTASLLDCLRIALHVGLIIISMPPFIFFHSYVTVS